MHARTYQPICPSSFHSLSRLLTTNPIQSNPIQFIQPTISRYSFRTTSTRWPETIIVHVDPLPKTRMHGSSFQARFVCTYYHIVHTSHPSLFYFRTSIPIAAVELRLSKRHLPTSAFLCFRASTCTSNASHPSITAKSHPICSIDHSHPYITAPLPLSAIAQLESCPPFNYSAIHYIRF